MFYVFIYFSGVVIGFVSEVVTVAEDGGNAIMIVSVLTGHLQRNVTVTFTTIPDSATGKAFDFEH